MESKSFGTCGHKLEDSLDKPISIKGYDTEGERTLCVGTYCDACQEWFRQHHYILRSIKAELQWLKMGKEVKDASNKG